MRDARSTPPRGNRSYLPLRHSSTDVAGREVQIGDWVRVVSVPGSVARMRRATKRAFARAVGKTFQIEAFDESGCAELDLTGKVGFDTIWIEPFCVRRIRRPREYSLRFRRILEIRRKLDRPRWSFGFVAKISQDGRSSEADGAPSTLRGQSRLVRSRKAKRDSCDFLRAGRQDEFEAATAEVAKGPQRQRSFRIAALG
jgi:hypothetical protein